MAADSIDETSVKQAALRVGIELAPAHIPGVVLYSNMLAEFAASVEAFPLDENTEPAAVFTPCTNSTPD